MVIDYQKKVDLETVVIVLRRHRSVK